MCLDSGGVFACLSLGGATALIGTSGSSRRDERRLRRNCSRCAAEVPSGMCGRDISARCNSISAAHRLQPRPASEDAGAGTVWHPSFFVLALRLRTEKISRRGGTAGRRGFSVALVHDDTASRFVARRDLLAGPRDATMTGGQAGGWRLEAGGPPRRLFSVRREGCSGDAMLPRRRRPPEGWFSRRATKPEPEPEQRAASSEPERGSPRPPAAARCITGLRWVRTG